ncbi:binding-protein-dependent transport systems inner membrane component [Xylanimonas cellulosilytica DSM 15894]|uniref:Binding-protein-dependent transport systems inner membrane component n=1 Tax=Xylanimonas cellulosilytica (strain DSM 15894 / JCM 12276 / CECT 5975 / KCTC 9989 / LMG 20990 / NBRC 107835 / XIL07) TaxID=446471 RepID=D1C0N3_XYLCX|nr:sugar ABC transporter permease [Xylanimonas cellulosilytica]ACZ32236.1 binding-protein-dependent transport systems inner membrane component [Xylanimonas cellulosilytica DSM 15894]
MDWLTSATSTGQKFTLMLIAIVLFVVVVGVILWLVDRPKNPSKWVLVAGFLGLPVLGLAFGLVYPAIDTIRNSFLDRTGTRFIGFDNYVHAFTNSEFLLVLRNTAIWVLLVPIAATFIGLVYAVVVDRSRFQRFAKALIFLPMAISMVGAGIIWRFVYEFRPVQGEIQQIGLLNQVLVWLGIPPQQFLIDQPWNTLFLIVVLIWIQTGFAMTLLSASIRAIPDDIVEAARLDGLSGVGMFRYITVPSIRPALVVVLTTIAITTLKVFDIVRTMTGGQFGTSVVANEFYTQSFLRTQPGLGAALAVLLFILVIPIIVYNVRQLRLAEEVR